MRSTIGIDPHAHNRNADLWSHVGPMWAPWEWWGGCLDGSPPLCKAAIGLRCNSHCFPPRSTQKKAKAMTTFDRREEAFEKQFAHDEDLKFKATARRNKMLGLWAAEKLGLSGAEADSYALSVVMHDLEDTSDHDVTHKIRKDFDAKGVAQSDHQIVRTMTELTAKAIADIKAGR